MIYEILIYHRRINHKSEFINLNYFCDRVASTILNLF